MNTVSDPNGEFLSDDEQTGGQETGGTLRSKYEAAIKLLQAKDTELAELRTAVTTRTLNDTWNELKVPKVFRENYKGDTDPEAIKAWWADISPFVNVDAAQAEQPQETDGQRAQREQLSAAQQAANLGGDAPGGYTAAFEKAKEIQGKQGTATQADLDAMFQAAGITKGTLTVPRPL